MRKNLMDKMRNSHNKEEQSQSGTWLYGGGCVQAYVTPDGQFLDLRPKGDKQ